MKEKAEKTPNTNRRVPPNRRKVTTPEQYAETQRKEKSDTQDGTLRRDRAVRSCSLDVGDKAAYYERRGASNEVAESRIIEDSGKKRARAVDRRKRQNL